MKDEELAEEYQIKKHHKRLFGSKPVVMQELKKTFIDGYHEGFKACAKSRLNVTTISDCPIKDEWHYVKDGLPKESGRYLVYFGGGENGVYPLDFDTEANDFGYWCLQVGASLGVTDTVFETVTERKEDSVIAWKEIVLPKENK